MGLVELVENLIQPIRLHYTACFCEKHIILVFVFADLYSFSLDSI